MIVKEQSLKVLDYTAEESVTSKVFVGVGASDLH